jgi:hypothetical protein
MANGLVQSSRKLANILRCFGEIGAAAKYLLRPGQHPASAEDRAERAAVETGAVATALVTDGLNVGPNAGIDRVAHSVPDTQEIERRRNLVRMLFNDFWSGVYEKPAAFVERLDQAEDYVNERLAASGEIWQLDAKTRAMLGLPHTKSSASLILRQRRTVRCARFRDRKGAG